MLEAVNELASKHLYTDKFVAKQFIFEVNGEEYEITFNDHEHEDDENNCLDIDDVKELSPEQRQRVSQIKQTNKQTPLTHTH
jgi:hypothetical protein